MEIDYLKGVSSCKKKSKHQTLKVIWRYVKRKGRQQSKMMAKSKAKYGDGKNS